MIERSMLIFRGCIAAFLAYWLQACSPERSKHIDAIENIHASSQFSLYERLDDVFENRPVKTGEVGGAFADCIQDFRTEWNPGGTKDELYLMIEGNNGNEFYYTVSAADDVIKYILVWDEKLDYGYRGGQPLLKIDCVLSDLGRE